MNGNRAPRWPTVGPVNDGLRVGFSIVWICAGLAALAIGALLAAFHGHVEDSGSDPANTLPYALIWITEGVAALGFAIAAIARRSNLCFWIAAGTCGLMVATWIALYEFQWEPFPLDQNPRNDNPDISNPTVTS